LYAGDRCCRASVALAVNSGATAGALGCGNDGHRAKSLDADY